MKNRSDTMAVRLNSIRFGIHRARRLRAGFTFVEVLAAMLLMSIVIPVALQGILMANRVGVTAMRKRQATQLAEQILNTQLATEDWISGDSSGDFGDDWPGFSYTLKAETWEQDTNLDTVTVIVTYTVQGAQYTETLTTVADPNENAETSTSTSSTSATPAS